MRFMWTFLISFIILNRSCWRRWAERRWNTNLIKIYESPGVYTVYTWPGLLVYMIIGGFEDALHPDSARLSVAVGRNSKACGNLLKAFVEIHNSLRSDNGFPLITQISASQEFLPRLHMTPDWNWDGVLVYAKIKYCTIKRILYYFKN